MNVEGLTRWIRPLKNRVVNMIARAVVAAVDDAKKFQVVQLDLLEGETRNEIERVQNYGFTSVPHAGAEAAVIFVGGRRDHGLAIAVDDRRYRIRNLESGEVAVYNDTGAKIVFKASGDIELTPKPGQVVALAGALSSVPKGEDLNTAIATLGGAIAAAVTAMGSAGPALPMVGSVAAVAGTAITTAVTSFNASAAAALSTKAKLS